MFVEWSFQKLSVGIEGNFFFVAEDEVILLIFLFPQVFSIFHKILSLIFVFLLNLRTHSSKNIAREHYHSEEISH